jgi:small subunit ribosomal protein S17
MKKSKVPLRTHGRTFVGTVIKDVFHKTTTIEFPRQVYNSKYERFQKRRTRIKVHIPEEFKIKKGDVISVIETRPISKTKNFMILEVMKK